MRTDRCLVTFHIMDPVALSALVAIGRLTQQPVALMGCLTFVLEETMDFGAMLRHAFFQPRPVA